VDGILTNNRRITNRCDDSVVAVLDGRVLPIRRSRGYVPEPVLLDDEGPSVLATGGMLKNTFALTTGRRVFLSQHIGDVSDADNAEHFAQAFADFSRLLRIEPEAVVCDMHPDYPTTHFARHLASGRGLRLMQVQQHHAHIVSCLAENGEHGPAIGVSWDGSGYGEDGAVWGGEFLLADRCGYERRYHLEYVPLPGGEQAVLNPCRMAAAHLARALGPEEAARRLSPIMGERECRMTLAIMDRREFSPLTSSAGRLFDAASALLGVRPRATYEGQAACELEAACEPQPCASTGPAGAYEFGYDGLEIRVGPMIRGICADLDRGEPLGRIAARFHGTMASIIVQTCLMLRQQTGIGTVAMSGGVMQNRTLLAAAVPALEAEGFRVLLQTVVPANDAGLSLGQAACALARLRRESER
jgi:hydrogenase maturation protein HypF